jgi:hypothetical protein
LVVPPPEGVPAVLLPPVLLPAVDVVPAVEPLLSVLSELPPQEMVTAPAIVNIPRAKSPVFIFMMHRPFKVE